MTDLLALVGTVITTASSMMNIAKKLKDADLQMLVSEFNLKIAQVNNEVATLLIENRKLKEELEVLKADKESPLIYNTDDGYYYDNETQNPYCPLCYESEKIRIHIIKDKNQCPKCKEYFKSKAYGAHAVKGPKWSPFDNF